MAKIKQKKKTPLPSTYANLNYANLNDAVPSAQIEITIDMREAITRSLKGIRSCSFGTSIINVDLRSVKDGSKDMLIDEIKKCFQALKVILKL